MTLKLEHVMIDIETMGSSNDAAIIAIGAAKFSPYADHVVNDSFYVSVSLESNVQAGLKMDPSTVMWWLHPDRAEAREALLAAKPIDLWSALDGFREWYGMTEKPTWGNGATFDLVIMRSAFQRSSGSECPWTFRDERCFRTLKNVHEVPSVQPPEGIAHHALYDAILQAYQVQAVYKTFPL